MKRILTVLAAVALAVFIGCEHTPPASTGEQVDQGQTATEEGGREENNKQSEGEEQEENSEQSEGEEQSGYYEKNDEVTKMYITIDGNKLEVALEKNRAVEALVELLKAGDIVYTADDYGGFEKVGYIGHTLPTDDTRITTEPGDIVLYMGNQICMFVCSNTWSYTKIGKINGYSISELNNLLGAGKGAVQVTISLK